MFVYEKYEQARKRHIRNCNKNLLHGPGYRSVNAVQLSLQSGRNTQLRTSTILVIFSCFRNTTDTIASNIKKTHNIYLYNRQYLLYIIIWGIVFSEYFKQKLFLFVDLYLSPDKLARKIYKCTCPAGSMYESGMAIPHPWIITRNSWNLPWIYFYMIVARDSWNLPWIYFYDSY